MARRTADIYLTCPAGRLDGYPQTDRRAGSRAAPDDIRPVDARAPGRAMHPHAGPSEGGRLPSLWVRGRRGRGIAAPDAVGVGYDGPCSEWVREAPAATSGRRDGGAHSVQAPADLGGQCGDLRPVHQLQDGFRVHEGDDDGVVRLLVPLRCRAE